MRSKKGFAFVETIITVVILSASLLYLYSTYSAILSDEKVRVYYDDPSFIYYTNYVKKFFEEYADLENIKRSKFNDTYVISIGTGYQNLLKDRSMAAALEKIVESFRINHIAIVKSDMFNNCFEGTEEYCESSIKNLNYNMQKYVTSLSDTKYNYYLVVEYAIRLDETTGKQVKCTPTIDKRCQTYYASIGLSGDNDNLILADYIKSLYVKQGENGLYHHDGTLTNGISDGSYRYAGKTVDNYICLGTDAETCPDSNLFRVIGVFGNMVKVIKDKSIGTMKWDSNGKNTWSTSSLNVYLNDTYFNSLDTSLKGKIAYTNWIVGGYSPLNINNDTPYEAYQNEITNPINETTYGGKIGLMHISDYAYSTVPQTWQIKLRNFGFRYGSVFSEDATSWLRSDNHEWTITRNSENETNAFYIYSYGNFGNYDVKNEFIVRPTFYLNSNLTYATGSGTSSDPIRIK